MKICKWNFLDRAFKYWSFSDEVKHMLSVNNISYFISLNENIIH